MAFESIPTILTYLSLPSWFGSKDYELSWWLSKLIEAIHLIWTVIISQSSGSRNLVYSLSSGCSYIIIIRDCSPLFIYPLTCCITQMTILVMQVSILVPCENKSHNHVLRLSIDRCRMCNVDRCQVKGICRRKSSLS